MVGDIEPQLSSPQIDTASKTTKEISSHVIQTTNSLDPFSPENHQLPPEEICQMYQVSGQPEITLHSFESYRASKQIHQHPIEQKAIETISETVTQKTTQTPKSKEPHKQTTPTLEDKNLIIQHINQDSCEDLERIIRQTNPTLFESDRKLRQQLFKRIINETKNKDTNQPLYLLEMSKNVSPRQRNKIQKRIIKQTLDRLLSQDKKNMYNIHYIFLSCDELPIKHESHEIKKTIDTGLSSSNPKIIEMSAKLIDFLPKKAQKKYSQKLTHIIENMLNQEDKEKQKCASNIIRHSPANEKLRLYKLSLQHLGDDKDVLTTMLCDNLESLPPEQILEIFNILLNSKHEDVQIKATEKTNLLSILSTEQEKDFILAGTNSIFPKIHKYFIQKIHKLDIDQKRKVIYHCLNQNNLKILDQTFEMIGYLSSPEEITTIFKSGLANQDEKIREVYINNLFYVPTSSIPEFINMVIKSTDPKMKHSLIRLFSRTTENQQPNLLKLISENNHGNYLIESPLYFNSPTTSSETKHKKFEKSDSEIILVGGSMQGKAIIHRKIPAESFLGWQQIYENYQTWIDNGFDYVPIESIISYRFDKKSQTVDVVSGVFDTSLARWELVSQLFVPELLKKREQILKVLKENNLSHTGKSSGINIDGTIGHDHTQNFCLRFFRDQNGQPDFTREPRLYLIDFDQTVSLQTPKS